MNKIFFIKGILLPIFIFSGILIASAKETLIPKIDNYKDVNGSTKELKRNFSKIATKANKSNSSLYFIEQERKFDFETDLESDVVSEMNSSFLASSLSSSTTDTIDQAVSQIHALFDKVMNEGRLMEKLDSGAIVSFPIGVGSGNYALLINDLIIKPEGTFFNAYLSFPIPQSDDKLAFMGRNIPLSSEGGLTGEIKLELLTTFNMWIGDGIQLTLNGEGKTYVSWDCDGFKEMVVDADILFDPEIFVPEDAQGNPREGQMIKSHFNVNIADWNDLVVQLSIDPFQIKGLDGVGFAIQDAVFDFSDYRNAPNVQFPSGYLSSYFVADNPNLWRGIYIREASIRLPKQFKIQEGQTSNTGLQGRISFIGHNLIIDEAGFSGTIIAENLLTLKQGKVGDWAFSLEKIGIKLEAGQLTKAGFEGQILVPIMDDNSAFKYTALIDLGNKYTFSVSPTETLNMDIWAAKVDLKPASYLEIKIEDDEFMPTACLHGQAIIEVSSSGLGVGADFESLVVQSKKPYVSCQSFSFGLEGLGSKMGNFPISINNIGFKNVSEDKVGITFNIILNLVGEGDGGFGAEAGLMVVGGMDSERGLTSWKYKYLELTKIAVDISGGAYKIKGSLAFFKNDETYGNGFNGQVSAEFIDIIKVDATAIFGKVEGYRYWYVDALATLPTGIPIGIFQLTSFGGGAFQYMRQLAPGESVGNSEYGTTVSGIVYKPDKAIYLGIKATVGMCTVGSESVFNGDATLEVTFGNGGGIRTIDFRGNAYFLVPPIPESMQSMLEKVDKMANASGGDDTPAYDAKGSLSGHIRIYMDFPNRILHANLEIYAEIAGGLIKGVGANNLAGWAVFHFEPGEWYIHMGSPDKPVGIEILGLVKLESYFMVGHNIPGSPPPPPEVSRILGDIDLDYMGDLNALGNGKGIAFGARFSMDTGDLTFLIFYARFSMGLGFDIMMKDYGNAQCMGRDGVIGVNGWYANGQSFAYITGKIGIKVKVFGKRIQTEILDLGVAAVLQAKLPNPFWMRGIVGGYYNVLGGMVKGSCKFEVVLGEKCQIVQEGSIVQELNAFADITPNTDEADVSVFNTPQAVFNMEIDKEFEMVDFDERSKVFKIQLDYFDIYHNNQKIPVRFKWNDDHTVVSIRPIDILPPETKLVAKAQISFKEKNGATWETVEYDGQIITENKETSFTTGIAPDNIPLSNIEYCYPLVNQYNFHKSEYSKGYLKMLSGQDYLFENTSEWTYKARFMGNDGVKIDVNLIYDHSKNELEYNIPSTLVNKKIYGLAIVGVPIGAASAVDENVNDVEQSIDTGGDDSTMMVTSKEAEGSIIEEKDRNLLTYHFRTSVHSTFKQKISTLFISTGFRRNIHSDVHELGTTVLGDELFDYYEINSEEFYNSLIQFNAVLNDNYFKQSINPLIYSNYINQSVLKIDREKEPFGIPPTKAFYVRQVEDKQMLTEEEINSNYTIGTNTTGAFIYDLIYYYFEDYSDLRTDAAYQISMNRNSSWYTKLVSTYFPAVWDGMYYFNVKYVVPGRNIVTTEYPLIIKNGI